ncbi:MAG: hypothetical protein KKA32_05710 [Actinobacteria bacterium]|nr:hypothetical protein [Actinomycetota bacterium]
MRWVRRLPSGTKLQVAWLVAAFLVVWACGPVGAGGGSSDGLRASALAQPAEAATERSPGVEVEPAVEPAVEAEVEPGVGPAGTPSPEAGADVSVDLVPGRSDTGNGVRLSVLDVVRESFSAEGAQAGDRLVSVRVMLENLGASSITYTALDLRVEGADGSVHVRPGTRRGPGSMITYGVLEPGGSVVGWRVFVVSGVAAAVRLSGHLARSG